MIKADEVFNASDFESIRLVVHFQNITTRTEVKDKKSAQLIEIGDKWLTLELPSKSCNDRHNVMVDVKRAGKGKQKDVDILSVTGKVFSVEDLGDNRMQVVVECVQFEERRWNDLLSLYANRQAEIQKFFAAVKG